MHLCYSYQHIDWRLSELSRVRLQRDWIACRLCINNRVQWMSQNGVSQIKYIQDNSMVSMSTSHPIWPTDLSMCVHDVPLDDERDLISIPMAVAADTCAIPISANAAHPAMFNVMSTYPVCSAINRLPVTTPIVKNRKSKSAKKRTWSGARSWKIVTDLAA